VTIMKKSLGSCEHPDRDVPGIQCGYPRPCPWHSAVIDLEKGTTTIPFTATRAMAQRRRIIEVARAVKTPVRKKPR